ncbi:hypothetical protein [Conchiformibius steedae]|uniref:Uncharacterized protein n=1 Tax=Conchiformibius steedae TaxID=153493 RepID=A0A3P2A8Z5_9NEIS|nr:hypothetical protein [Conchiformibius steedae]RRD90083.1 hypothetical protein EII21_06585 [Conchiformibius steedae]
MSEQELLQKIEALEQKLIQSSLEHQERETFLLNGLAVVVAELIRHGHSRERLQKGLTHLDDRIFFTDSSEKLLEFVDFYLTDKKFR